VERVPEELVAERATCTFRRSFCRRSLCRGCRAVRGRAQRGDEHFGRSQLGSVGVWDGGLLELLPRVDVLLPNAAEVCRIASEDDPAAAAQRLAADGPLVAVKLGADGAIAAQAGMS